MGDRAWVVLNRGTDTSATAKGIKTNTDTSQLVELHLDKSLSSQKCGLIHLTY